MEEKKLPFTGREKIRFNVPPFTGREYEYVRQAVENQKICGDGEFTKKASHWFEEKTGEVPDDDFLYPCDGACRDSGGYQTGG